MLNTKSNQEERVVKKLTFEDHLNFKAMLSSELTTSLSLAKKFNNLFGNIFKDYSGCVIEPDPQNPLHPIRLTLSFTPKSDNGKGQLEGFVEIGLEQKARNGKVGSIVGTMLASNERRKSVETFQPTQDLVDIVFPYLYKEISYNMKPTVFDFMRQKLVVEDTEKNVNQFGYNPSPIIFNMVYGINIDQLLTDMYGKRTEDGDHRYGYQVQLQRQIQGIPNRDMTVTPNYMYRIDRLDLDIVNDLAAEIGAYSRIGDRNIVTDR